MRQTNQPLACSGCMHGSGGDSAAVAAQHSLLGPPAPSQPGCMPLDPSQAVVCYLGPPSHLFWNILPMSLWVLAVTLGTILFGERGGRAEAWGLHLPSTACVLLCLPRQAAAPPCCCASAALSPPLHCALQSTTLGGSWMWAT